MQIGMVGLGKMGANMVRRLIKGGHQCIVYDRNPDLAKDLSQRRGYSCRQPGRDERETDCTARGVGHGASRTAD